MTYEELTPHHNAEGSYLFDGKEVAGDVNSVRILQLGLFVLRSYSVRVHLYRSAILG